MAQLARSGRVAAAVCAASLACALVLALAGSARGAEPNEIPDPSPYRGAAINTTSTTLYGCDFLVPDTSDPNRTPLHSGACLQPWPNDFFTRRDRSTDTGRRVNLKKLAMPRNQPAGIPVPVKPVSPAEHNLNDGFSPGNMIVVKVRGLTTPEAFEQTGAVSIDDPGAYADPAQPVVVINAETGERHPVWAEVDANPPMPANRNLLIRPLVNFEEGTRYVVALRDMRNGDGELIRPTNAFRVYRDNLRTGRKPIEKRRPHMESLFETLGEAGISRSNLYLAWDFTVASERNLSERMLHIRDRSFAELGDTNLANGVVEGRAPRVSFNGPGLNFDPCGSDGCQEGEDARIARQVRGTVQVPCWMNLLCLPLGNSFNNLGDRNGIPDRNGSVDVDFICRMPRESLDGPIATGAKPSLYGHGLLGSMEEVRGGAGGNVDEMAFEQQFVFCATDWYGFASQNLPNILLILQDLSLFPMLADGSQQGFLNFLFLGRAMIHPDGFANRPPFQAPDGDDPGTEPDPVMSTDELFYDGNSQGGILGGALTAVAPDFRQAALGVPGMNYSTLLRRSVDFEPYSEGEFASEICGLFPAPLDGICGQLPENTPLGLYDNYPNQFERPIVLSLMQMLWDRGDANGYAHHMTDDPLPNTPPHQVLLQAAFGDHQVANVTAEVEARTIGAGVYQPALDPTDTDPQSVDPGPNQRHWEADGSEQIFGLPSITSFPYDGSALVYWDGGPLGFDDPFDSDTANDGTATPADANVPPRPEDGYGADPHSYPRNDPKARAQKGAFLSPDGLLRNPCTTTNNVVDPPQPIPFETGTPIPCYANGFLGP